MELIRKASEGGSPGTIGTGGWDGIGGTEDSPLIPAGAATPDAGEGAGEVSRSAVRSEAGPGHTGVGALAKPLVFHADAVKVAALFPKQAGW